MPKVIGADPPTPEQAKEIVRASVPQLKRLLDERRRRKNVEETLPRGQQLYVRTGHGWRGPDSVKRWPRSTGPGSYLLPALIRPARNAKVMITPNTTAKTAATTPATTLTDTRNPCGASVRIRP